MSAKVVICIPVKNRQSAMGNTLDSVLKQNYDNYNVYACDGLSTDNTGNNLMDMQSKTEGKLLMYQTKEAGYVNTMNYVLNKVAEKDDVDYFCFVDSDDIVQPNKLEEQVKFLEEHPDVDVVSTSMVHADRQILVNSLVNLNHEQIDAYLKENNPISSICHFQTCLFRKRVLEKFTAKKYFYDEYENGRAGEGFLYTLYFLGYKFANINTTVYVYTKGVLKDSMSSTIIPEFANNIDLLDFDTKHNVFIDMFNIANPPAKKRGRPKKVKTEE